jgi:hypothetical protein
MKGVTGHRVLRRKPMPWKVVERKIGRAGGVKQRTTRQSEWDQKYGEGKPTSKAAGIARADSQRSPSHAGAGQPG